MSCQRHPNWCDWWIALHATGLPLPWLSCGCLHLAGHSSCCNVGMLREAVEASLGGFV